MVTVTGVPDVPEDGDAEHPVMVQVNDGAPASATVTPMLTVTEAAWAGKDERENRITSTPAVVSKTTPLLERKGPVACLTLRHHAI
jgi:hypothetical protein